MPRGMTVHRDFEAWGGRKKPAWGEEDVESDHNNQQQRKKAEMSRRDQKNQIGSATRSKRNQKGDEGRDCRGLLQGPRPNHEASG